MLFKRRAKSTVFERVWIAVWPRRNHARSTRYVIKRVMRIRATPHAIGAGVAAGAFASFMPFIGFHFILAFVIAYLLRGSMIAAGLGTAVGNPLTFPAIWASTLSLGRTILGVDSSANSANFATMFRESGFGAVWDPFIKPMALGGIPLGLIVAGVLYFLTRGAVAAFQKRRAAKAKRVANDNDLDAEHEELAPTPEKAHAVK